MVVIVRGIVIGRCVLGGIIHYQTASGVSNGVRQDSVLSLVLFSMYLDGLLERLSQSAVGCYWGHQFASALCYVDDIALLAPCASTLRQMLSICDSYATSHGLVFNAAKPQLICFRRRPIHLYDL